MAIFVLLADLVRTSLGQEYVGGFHIGCLKRALRACGGCRRYVAPIICLRTPYFHNSIIIETQNDNNTICWNVYDFIILGRNQNWAYQHTAKLYNQSIKPMTCRGSMEIDLDWAAYLMILTCHRVDRPHEDDENRGKDTGTRNSPFVRRKTEEWPVPAKASIDIDYARVTQWHVSIPIACSTLSFCMIPENDEILIGLMYQSLIDKLVMPFDYGKWGNQYTSSECCKRP
ncbi:uncharacterized protein CLUP02_09477 [Colletotrichum lupini]|uniref:Uncharacterized protein n=1 Tax=Colletotrichum lupini TaxID=145971 RepID=A0A9Q8SWC7_9PEZI|nr:uncharacterized protein CLUP02_09477 [Colletotrichum lupini]UQC83981.1 hypothetical protein CLUP02_09477 [Colletotrichum lupini]